MLSQASSQTPAPPAPPGTPSVTIQTTPEGAVQVFTPQQMRPITQAEIQALRQRRGEMSEQLSSARDRREETLDELRDAPAGTEAGLQQQAQVLSDRIVAIERDLEASGQTLRSGLVPEGTILVAPSRFDRPGGRTDDLERMASMGMLALLVIVGLTVARRWRRRRRGGDQNRTVVYDERMERLEEAVDAIAIEIERVGESQRYQAKLLAEANMMPAMGSAQREPVRAREYDRDR